LNTGHAYRTIADAMEVITTGKKGKYFNILERYHIYEISRENRHMDSAHIDTHNPIFETLRKITLYHLLGCAAV
jgi:hypothetical protein